MNRALRYICLKIHKHKETRFSFLIMPGETSLCDAQSLFLNTEHRSDSTEDMQYVMYQYNLTESAWTALDDCSILKRPLCINNEIMLLQGLAHKYNALHSSCQNQLQQQTQQSKLVRGTFSTPNGLLEE